MKLLFFAERVNIDLFKGDSLLLKRMAEGLAEQGHEIHAVCHGSSNKIKVHRFLNYWFYSKVFSFPLTSFFSSKKLFSLIAKEKFDAVILKLPSFNGKSFWFSFPSLIESKFYSKIVFQLKKKGISFFVFVEGITEKENFVSSFMGASKNQQLNVMHNSKGIISLSGIQNKLLESMKINNPKTFFPAPVDTEKYKPKKLNYLDLDKKIINLLYLSSSCDAEDFIPFFSVLEKNNCRLYIISPFSFPSACLKKELEKRNLISKTFFLNNFSNKRMHQLIPCFDAGVYLKKFNSSFADASFMMKISEYLSCGLPVLVPETIGPLEQAGKAGINFEKNHFISKKEFNLLSETARKTAVKKLDLKNNILKLEDFLNEFK